jgi:uncharacterized MAPEG superfamily protein
MAEMQGGTFTISNGGVYGSLMSSPILNPPQSGILGMHKIQDRPVVVNGQIVIRPMMYLALSYDHRIVDGKGAVTFLVRVKEALEDPRRLLMDLFTLAALLQVAQYTLFAIAREPRTRHGLHQQPPRPPPSRQMSPVTARLQRAMNNHFEGLILFTLAVWSSPSATSPPPDHPILPPGPILPPASSMSPPMPSAGAPGARLIWGVGFFATLTMLVASPDLIP